jgi:hypothetical protein
MLNREIAAHARFSRLASRFIQKQPIFADKRPFTGITQTFTGITQALLDIAEHFDNIGKAFLNIRKAFLVSAALVWHHGDSRQVRGNPALCQEIALWCHEKVCFNIMKPFLNIGQRLLNIGKSLHDIRKPLCHAGKALRNTGKKLIFASSSDKNTGKTHHLFGGCSKARQSRTSKPNPMFQSRLRLRDGLNFQIRFPLFGRSCFPAIV